MTCSDCKTKNSCAVELCPRRGLDVMIGEIVLESKARKASPKR